jgi:hypothetical protein
VLLFELFPLFVALVSIVAGVWLFMLNLEADACPEHPEPADRSRSAAPGGGSNHGLARESRSRGLFIL